MHGPRVSPTQLSSTAPASRAERDAHTWALKTGRPTPLKLARLLRAFEIMLPEAEAEVKANGSRRSPWVEGALALRLVLISGRELEEIHGLHLLPRVKEFDPSWATPRLLQIAGHQPALWLAVSPPPQRTASLQEAEFAAPASHAVWFGLDELSKRWLRALHSRLRMMTATDVASDGIPLFSVTSAEGLLKAADAFREQATRKMGSSETAYLPKVQDCAQFLRRQLAVCSPGDPATSWLMTNTSPPRNATTGSYTSISLRDAQRYQAEAVAVANSRDSQISKPAAVAPDLPAVLNERVIGSRFCPSRAALTDLRDRLLARARRGRGRMSSARLSEFDQAFTAYSWLFFSLHTGWRPPPDPILPEAYQLDWARGAFFLEDKLVGSTNAISVIDGKAERGKVLDDIEEEDAIALEANENDGAHATAGLKKRWLPLGKRVLAQVRAYHDHVERRSLQSLSGPPLISRSEVLAYVRGVSGVTKDLRWNFGRHYLRSSLVGKVSVEVINAYLGHWDKGSEPWANGSCLDPVAYVHEIRTALDELFPAEEWPVIHGFR